MVTLMKKTPTDTDEIREELNHWLGIHHTNVVSIAVQTKYGAPFIIRYTIKTSGDFDCAVYFIQNAREDGGIAGFYSRTDVRHRMGAVAKKILAHEPEHPYKRGLQWLVADAEDGIRYETDEELFGKSVDFYNLIVASIPDRYKEVFDMAVDDMQRKRHPEDYSDDDPDDEPKEDVYRRA